MGYTISLRSTENSKIVEEILDKHVYDYLPPGVSYMGTENSYGPANSFGFDTKPMPTEIRIPLVRFVYELSILIGQNGAYYYDDQLINEPKQQFPKNTLIADFLDKDEYDAVEKRFNELLTLVKNLLV